MIKGIGTDIVDIARIDDKHASRILSAEELLMYEGFAAVSRKREFLAGRFAVKEALTKAFAATPLFFAFNEMSVENDGNGRPLLVKPQLAGIKCWLSISHERDYAIALCILEDA